MHSPVFSIITVTYNAIETLERTIQSVLAQDNTLFEYIIIDGGSTDGTVGCIEYYSDRISYWSSERDGGIYDAMNKGINKACGEWIFFLGADDRLNPNILNQVHGHLDNSVCLVYGDVLFDNGKRFVSSFNYKTIINNTIHHQGAFYNVKLFDNFRYDTAVKIMADYELNLLIYLNKMKRKKVEIDIAECDLNGVSSETVYTVNEINYIRAKYFNPLISNIFSLITKLKYYIHYELL